MTKPEGLDDWISDHASMDIGGNFLPQASGFVYTFSLIDPKERPKEVQKKFEGKDAGTKYQHRVLLYDIVPQKKAYLEILQDEKPKKAKQIVEIEKNREYIFEMSKTCDNEFAKFLLVAREKQPINDKTIFQYTRIGDSFDTSYTFTILESKPNKN